MNRSVYMLLGLVGLISGCQSTNLYTEPDTGSTVFPFDITAEARFPCRKVGFELNLRNEGTEDNADYGYREFFINDGDTFGLISGLKPGVYSFDEFHCYARPGRIFSTGGSYFTVPTYVKFEVLENQISLSKFSLNGQSTFDSSGRSSFRVNFIYATNDLNQKIYDDLKGLQLPESWTIVKP